ncbi:MAG: hypothetical protein ABUL72_03070 [Armatimonadota bacterium]
MVKSSAFKAVVVGCAVLGGAASAMAQTKAQGLSFHVGQFFPQSALARDWEGGRWFLAGIDYDVTGKYNFFGQSMGTSISADIYSKGSFTAVPIMINGTQRNGRTFMGLGAGVSFIHRKDDQGMSFAETQLGYTFFFGIDLQTSEHPLFLQAKYYGNSRPDLAGFGVSIGTRF